MRKKHQATIQRLDDQISWLKQEVRHLNNRASNSPRRYQWTVQEVAHNHLAWSVSCVGDGHWGNGRSFKSGYATDFDGARKAIRRAIAEHAVGRYAQIPFGPKGEVVL